MIGEERSLGTLSKGSLGLAERMWIGGLPEGVYSVHPTSCSRHTIIKPSKYIIIFYEVYSHLKTQYLHPISSFRYIYSPTFLLPLKIHHSLTSH